MSGARADISARAVIPVRFPDRTRPVRSPSSPLTRTNTAATRAFAAVFSDVDQQGGGSAGQYTSHNRDASTVLEYYGVDGRLIFRSAVPASPGNASVSFFGAVFTDARIGSVRIIAGNVAPGPFDENGEDIVMMDDFVYGEPQAAAISVPARRR
jgi:hypothetical protein